MKSSARSSWLRRSRLRWAGPSTEDMEDAPVTAATGALGPVIAKLAALLGSEYRLRWRTRRDVKFIRSKLKPVHSILWNIWEKVELDAPSIALKMEALDLADELDDTIVDFILSMEHNRSNTRLVQTKIKTSPFHDFKKQASDVLGRCRSKWTEKKKPFSSLFSCGKLATDDSSPSKPRAYPFVPFAGKDTSQLVGMVTPLDKIIRHLIGEDGRTPVELQLKWACILGMAGMGKTTLANLVYQAIRNMFQFRAFVSVTRPGGNMREVLSRILEQVAPNSSVPLAGTNGATEEEHLIDILSNILKDKRYLVIIDDVWNEKEWEMIMNCLPENNLGSRIVVTTRICDVAQIWAYGVGVDYALYHTMLPMFDEQEGWVYKIGENNIVTGMISLKADLFAEGFDYEHPIVHMCGGNPLAVRCMLSAVAQEREKQAKQGLHAQACDVQDEIHKYVMENGIHNTPGFEPMVESLQLDFDGLPHYMIKTCLLYCSIYPEGHVFDSHYMSRRWISERFVYKEEEANAYIGEFFKRGLIIRDIGGLRMHPIMRHFLRWKASQDFITCSSEITTSYNSCRIRRLFIDNSPCRDNAAVQADPLSALDWYHVRSLVVYDEGIERVPFEKLEGVRVLDLSSIRSVQDHHLKDICGLGRLRHLLGLNSSISGLPPEIVKLQCLETFEASGNMFGGLPGFIGGLQQLRTLEVRNARIRELPREIGSLLKLQTLRIRNTRIAKLPREIWSLQQLRTLDINCSKITVLPREVGSIQQLRTLDISGTAITVVPKDIRKLQHLEHLLMSDTQVAKIPREIGALKELKRLKLDYSVVALPLEVCAWVKLPDYIHKFLNKSGLVSELAGEMLSFKRPRFGGAEGGLVVGAKQMHIPPWIKEHFNDLVTLDITICKLEEEGLKILREMPQLDNLTLRFQVVPREPVVISSEGFANLSGLIVDSRVPRITFEAGAMPVLEWLMFRFQFYGGPPNKDRVGINHLGHLGDIDFVCNKDWYPGAESPCIRHMIDVVRKEAEENGNYIVLNVCGRKEDINPPWNDDDDDDEEEEEEEEEKEEEEEEERSGVGEIEEDIQA